MEYNWQDKKILIVEDNPSNYRLLIAAISRTNVQHKCVFSGIQAFNMIQENSFDLILLDVQLPDFDGFAAAKKIRTFHTDIPIIIITAVAQFIFANLTFESGCNEFLIKPISTRTLIPILSKYLDKPTK